MQGQDNLPEMCERVYLVGFMGAGKSAVGHLVAEKLDWTFIDLDSEIEKGDGRSIALIFEESGEPYFRAIESEYLRSVSAGNRRVISLGGGTYATPANRLFVEANGLSIYLEASLSRIRDRISADRTRPLFEDVDSVAELYVLRKRSYQMARVRIDTDSFSVEKVASEVVRAFEDA